MPHDYLKTIESAALPLRVDDADALRCVHRLEAAGFLQADVVQPAGHPEVVMVHRITPMGRAWLSDGPCGDGGGKTATIVTVNARTGKFVVQADDRRCAVFARIHGPDVAVGEVLQGDVLACGVRRLRRADDIIQVLGDSGPVSWEMADAWVNGTTRHLAGPAVHQPMHPAELAVV